MFGVLIRFIIRLWRVGRTLSCLHFHSKTLAAAIFPTVSSLSTSLSPFCFLYHSATRFPIPSFRSLCVHSLFSRPFSFGSKCTRRRCTKQPPEWFRWFWPISRLQFPSSVAPVNHQPHSQWYFRTSLKKKLVAWLPDRNLAMSLAHDDSSIAGKWLTGRTGQYRAKNKHKFYLNDNEGIVILGYVNVLNGWVFIPYFHQVGPVLWHVHKMVFAHE